MIVTNKRLKAENVATFHEGRGSQEGIFAELKTACQMGYVPVRTLMGNQIYLPAGLFAHNLTREWQMRTTPRARNTTAKRTALWVFVKLDTLRKKLIRRAGRLTRPHGKLTLTMSANNWIKKRVLETLAALKKAA